MFINSSAIVLKAIPFSDTSLICRLFTKEKGKISIIAKGARRKKNPLVSILECGNIIRLQYIFKESRDIQLLKEASFSYNIYNIRDNLEKLLTLYTIVEIMDKTTHPFISGRVSLLPSKITETITYLEQTSDIKPTIISHPGYGTVLISWFINPNEISDEKAIEIIHDARNTIRNNGGHIIIEHCSPTIKSEIDVWGDVGKSLSTMLKMKEQYDPKGILNPGRFVGGI